MAIFRPEQAETSWQAFAAAVPECASDADTQDTFDCLRGVNSSSISQAVVATGFTSSFGPVIDGPGGLLPDLPSRLFQRGHFARLPSIAGTNLDEGSNLFHSHYICIANVCFVGALFTPQNINSSDTIRETLIAISSPSPRGPAALAAAVETILKLYPDIPADGSPFNTGNKTFGLSSQYKRSAAICEFVKRISFYTTYSCNSSWGFQFSVTKTFLQSDIQQCWSCNLRISLCRSRWSSSC